MSAPHERSIFLQALEMESDRERAEYVSEACRHDPHLRASVEALLLAHQRPGNVIDQPVARLPLPETLQPDAEHADRAATDQATAAIAIGATIGDYRLLEQIGEGGFGLVFVAEQARPVRRRVALKIIKPGTVTKEVLARFEAERQAVAMMNHPHIAQIFDAGVTADGRPYFVMELVRGVPLTDFCDAQSMGLSERIELLIDVCGAVHHAHQKGVIHRDLKPSNVMVTSYDGKPIVKVIDFGIAKAIGQNLTDKTIYTRFFSMLGTPLYMSPEQAEMSGLDVDTRSDIYSLGVMLYELLTGTTPFTSERFNSVGYDELRRILREEEPPRPSARLTTLGEDLSTISRARGCEALRLAPAVRGDLDWIVLKAMEKDRTRRYESAAAMANDLRRFLTEQPIEARPPSKLYQVRKFARRNRLPLVTASLLITTMMIGTGLSLWQLSRAIDERNAKEAALREAVDARNEADEARLAVEQFATQLTKANLLVTSGQSHADAGRWPDALDAYSDAVAIQPSYYLPWVQRGQLYIRLQLWPEAAADFAAALRLGAPTDGPQWWGVATLLAANGLPAQATDLSNQNWQQITEHPERPDWNAVRSAVMANAWSEEEKAATVAALCERWLKTDLPRQRDGDRLGERPPNWYDGPPPGQDRRQDRPPARRDAPPEYRERPPVNGERPPERRDGPPWVPPREGGREALPRGELRQGTQREFVPRGVQLYVTGVAHLRAGNYVLADKRLRQAAAEPDWPGNALTEGPHAIVLHQLGREREAIAALNAAQQSLKHWNSPSETPSTPRRSGPWIDTVEANQWFAEATRLILREIPPPDEALRREREATLRRLTGDGERESRE